MKFAHCLHIVLVIGKYTDIFKGRKKIFWGWIFYGENFSLGWKFLGVNFSGEILHGENLPEFVYRMFVICLFSRCWSHCTCRDTLRELSGGSFQRSWNSLGIFFWGRGDFPREKFPWGNYHQEKFSMENFWGINFPGGGGYFLNRDIPQWP